MQPGPAPSCAVLPMRPLDARQAELVAQRNEAIVLDRSATFQASVPRPSRHPFRDPPGIRITHLFTRGVTVAAVDAAGSDRSAASPRRRRRRRGAPARRVSRARAAPVRRLAASVSVSSSTERKNRTPNQIPATLGAGPPGPWQTLSESSIRFGPSRPRLPAQWRPMPAPMRKGRRSTRRLRPRLHPPAGPCATTRRAQRGRLRADLPRRRLRHPAQAPPARRVSGIPALRRHARRLAP